MGFLSTAAENPKDGVEEVDVGIRRVGDQGPTDREQRETQEDLQMGANAVRDVLKAKNG